MPITIDATFENGVLKPKQELILPEGADVRLTVSLSDEVRDPLASVIGICDGPTDGAANHDRYIYGDPP
jgi:predicted DNA-binding antitoxin AbrB/MazE fold protein